MTIIVAKSNSGGGMGCSRPLLFTLSPIEVVECRLSRCADEDHEFSCNNGADKAMCSDIIDPSIPARTIKSAAIGLAFLVRGIKAIERICP